MFEFVFAWFFGGLLIGLLGFNVDWILLVFIVEFYLVGYCCLILILMLCTFRVFTFCLIVLDGWFILIICFVGICSDAFDLCWLCFGIRGVMVFVLICCVYLSLCFVMTCLSVFCVLFVFEGCFVFACGWTFVFILSGFTYGFVCFASLHFLGCGVIMLLLFGNLVVAVGLFGFWCLCFC